MVRCCKCGLWEREICDESQVMKRAITGFGKHEARIVGTEAAKVLRTLLLSRDCDGTGGVFNGPKVTRIDPVKPSRLTLLKKRFPHC